MYSDLRFMSCKFTCPPFLCSHKIFFCTSDSRPSLPLLVKLTSCGWSKLCNMLNGRLTWRWPKFIVWIYILIESQTLLTIVSYKLTWNIRSGAFISTLKYFRAIDVSNLIWKQIFGGMLCLNYYKYQYQSNIIIKESLLWNVFIFDSTLIWFFVRKILVFSVNVFRSINFIYQRSNWEPVEEHRENVENIITYC
jgi:hypothetical protein